MGGMQALQWMVSYPDRIRSAIPISTALKHTPQQIAFNEVGRQAVMAERTGEAGLLRAPLLSKGLAVARMIGHITYMSEASMAEKFGRRLKVEAAVKFSPDFEVEGTSRTEARLRQEVRCQLLHLHHKGDGLLRRRGCQDATEIFKGLRAKVLVIAFKSDWLYPAHQSQEIGERLQVGGRRRDILRCPLDVRA